MNKFLRCKEGTVSVLFGCHSVMHSFVVLAAWIKLYGRFPKFWQLVCIFLHDIGHWGLDYLSDIEDKKKHWELGAKVAKKLFGKKGYDFCAGHCIYSNLPKSALYKADKYSWYIAPVWWMYCNAFAEPLLAVGHETRTAAINCFRENVKKSIESNQYVSTHDFYLEKVEKVNSQNN